MKLKSVYGSRKPDERISVHPNYPCNYGVKGESVVGKTKKPITNVGVLVV